MVRGRSENLGEVRGCGRAGPVRATGGHARGILNLVGSSTIQRVRLGAAVLAAALGAGALMPARALASDPAPRAASAEPEYERSAAPRAGVSTLCLPNGVCVHIRPMPGRRVAIVATLAGGAVLEDPGDEGLTLAATASWRRPGAAGGGGGANPPGEREPGDAALAEGDQPAFRVRVDSVPEGVGLRVSVEPARVGEALAVMAEMIAQPRADEGRLTAWRGRLKGLAARERSPERQVARALMNLLVPEGVPGDSQLPPVERLMALEADRIEAWLVTRVAPAPMEVAIAGPVDLGAAEAAAAKALSVLPGRARVEVRTFDARRRASRASGPINEEAALDIPPGQAHLMAGFTGPDVGMIAEVRALYVALGVARDRLNAMRAEGTLEAEMIGARLMPARQHPGLGAAILMARVSDSGDAPAKGMVALHRVLHELVSAGPREEEVAAARTRAADDARKDAADPEYWAGVLSIAALQGIEIDALADAPEAYEALTAVQVQEALRRWYAVENRFSLVASPARPK